MTTGSPFVNRLAILRAVVPHPHLDTTAIKGLPPGCFDVS